MPSTYTGLGFNKQASGENENTWGEVLNDEAIDLIDEAIRGRVAFTLSGNKTLTSGNGVSNESRCALIHVTGGAGGTVTVPDLSKLYVVINQATGAVVISAGGATEATVAAGSVVQVACDGQTAVRKVFFSDFAGARLTNVGNPTSDQDAATKLYVDNLAFGGAELPGQAGNAGKFLTTNGSTASWGDLGLSTFRSATSGAIYAKNSANSLLGGIAATNSGLLQIINSAGNRRIQSDPDGTVTAYSDGGSASVLATQNYALGLAVAMAVSL